MRLNCAIVCNRSPVLRCVCAQIEHRKPECAAHMAVHMAAVSKVWVFNPQWCILRPQCQLAVISRSSLHRLRHRLRPRHRPSRPSPRNRPPPPPPLRRTRTSRPHGCHRPRLTTCGNRNGVLTPSSPHALPCQKAGRTMLCSGNGVPSSMSPIIIPGPPPPPPPPPFPSSSLMLSSLSVSCAPSSSPIPPPH